VAPARRDRAARAWLAGLLLLLAASAALRLPALGWLQDVKPELQFSLHPDENRFVRYADEFASKPRFHHVLGMTVHEYLIAAAVRAVSGRELDLVLVGRAVSLAYSLALIALLAWISLRLTGSALHAALAASFLAFAPLFGIHARVGVADMAACFYLWAALALVWRQLEAPSTRRALLAAGAIGAALAHKLLVPLALPAAAVAWAERKDPQRVALFALALATAFLAGNLWSLAPWDLARALYRLFFDAATVEGSSSLLANAAFYAHGSLSVAGLAAGLCATWGAWVASRAAAPRVLGELRALVRNGGPAALLCAPGVVVGATLAVHGLLMLAAELHATRFALPLLPALCLLAAGGARDLLERLPGRTPAALLAVALVAYSAHNAAMLERVFLHDPRVDAAEWIAAHVREPDEAGAFMYYARVRGTVELESVDPAELPRYLVTCDLEYERYLESEDARRIYHPYGGQERLEFFRALLEGRSAHRLVSRIEAPLFGPEQRLARGGWLLPLAPAETFTPVTCLIFERPPEPAR
jgi:hypothetical protein